MRSSWRTGICTALFLLQVDCSPFRAEAHAASLARVDDPLLDVVSVPNIAALLLPLPLEVLYELGLVPAIRLAAVEEKLDDDQLEAGACWRAITWRE